MKINSDQVKKVAKLANLPLNSEEIQLYSQQLSKILDYINQLNCADTLGVEPTFNVTGLNNVMSEDKTIPSLSQEETLSNALSKKNSMFVTKGVFEDD